MSNAKFRFSWQSPSARTSKSARSPSQRRRQQIGTFCARRRVRSHFVEHGDVYEISRARLQLDCFPSTRRRTARSTRVAARAFCSISERWRVSALADSRATMNKKTSRRLLNGQNRSSRSSDHSGRWRALNERRRRRWRRRRRRQLQPASE